MTTESPAAVPRATDPAWAGAARWWGWFVGLAFIVASVLYLAEARGLLGAAPTYQATSAGQLHDEAAYWLAFFAYRNATLWDYYLRDGLFVLAYLGFVPLVLAANAITGGGRAFVQLAGGFLLAGAVLGVLNAVTFYVDVSYWRSVGWDQVPPEIMVAIGRGTEFMSDLSAWTGTFAQVAFAIGLAYLGAACRREPALPRRLALIAWLTAAVSAASVALIIAAPTNVDLLRDALGALSGVVLTPILVVALGRHVAAAVSREAATA